MIIKHVRVKNYRLLKDVSLSFDQRSTLIVGRNNTGKTSLTEIFRSFLSGNASSFRYEDFSLSALKEFQTSLTSFDEKKDEDEVRKLIPSIELELLLNYENNKDSYGGLGDFILDLDEGQFETKVLLKFQLADGKIKPFFDGLVYDDKHTYFKDLKRRILDFFEVSLYAIDPSNEMNRVKLDFVKVRRLMFADFINAQRGLDDETHNEKDVLGKSLGNIFKSASLHNAPAEFKSKSEGINTVVEELQTKVDSDFQEKVEALLPTLSIFGYPGLQDPNLSASTELNVKSLLESNTRVFYKKDEYFTLPETYNGLGFRNLIYILFQIYEFFRKYQSAEQTPKGHIIFIEEPEAHLHPQMQEVFIRQLDEIVAEFEKSMNSNQKWPIQFIVSSHSTHIANEADFKKVRYFLSKDGSGTKVKDLSEVFNARTEGKDRDFVHKYMTLTKCDLYFADKAILIEGATERILLPEIIKKVDDEKGTTLRRKYLSVIEIGGAYAHHFYKLLDFLELRTLVITDLDSTKAQTKEDDNGVQRTSYSSCLVAKGTHSSNAGLRYWFKNDDADEKISLSDITSKRDEDKIDGLRCIAFQVPEEGKTACGRSFEDAFILANRGKFGLVDTLGETEAEEQAFEVAEKIGKGGKTNFAIKYAIDKTDWNVPKYIQEGLIWLVADSAAQLPDSSQDDHCEYG